MTFLRGWQVSFVLLAAIWGCSFWWIKLGLTAFVPTEVAFGRLALGAAALLLALVVSRTPLPRSIATWRHLAVVAVLLNSVPFTLFAIGQTYVSSILAGIINAVTPLMTLIVVMAAFPEEKPTVDRVVGLLVGFVGVLVVLGVWQGFSGGTALGIAACFAAVCCYGLAFPYARRHLSSTPDGPLALAAGQVCLGALFLLPVVVVVNLTGNGGAPTGLTGEAVLGMLALGILGSGTAYVLNFRVMDAAGASTASAVTYLTPAFAVVVGVAFLGEHLAWYQPVGALIVLLGVAQSQGRLRFSRSTPTPVEVGGVESVMRRGARGGGARAGHR